MRAGVEVKASNWPALLVVPGPLVSEVALRVDLHIKQKPHKHSQHVGQTRHELCWLQPALSTPMTQHTSETGRPQEAATGRWRLRIGCCTSALSASLLQCAQLVLLLLILGRAISSNVSRRSSRGEVAGAVQPKSSASSQEPEQRPTSSQSQDWLKPCTRCQPLLLKQAASRLRRVEVMLRPSKQRSGVGTLHCS